MAPLVAVLRVVNVLPQVQVTSVVTYSGWMSFFMVSSRVTAAGSHPCGYVNRSQRPSVPSPTAWGRIDLDACSTLAGAGLFLPRRRGPEGPQTGHEGRAGTRQRLRARTAETREASSRGLNGL